MLSFFPELEDHLLIATLGKIVIFYDIKGFLRGSFLPITQFITSNAKPEIRE